MMTPKERAAMQQALEALEELFHSNSTKVAVEKYNIAHNALREALSEQQVDWKEEAMRLAGLNAKNVGELRKLEVEQAEQEPVAWSVDGALFWTDEMWEEWYSRNPKPLPLYATPVRTKDLTDDEAQKLWNDTSSIVPMWAHHLHFARAVIAADREKNK